MCVYKRVRWREKGRESERYIEREREKERKKERERERKKKLFVLLTHFIIDKSLVWTFKDFEGVVSFCVSLYVCGVGRFT